MTFIWHLNGVLIDKVISILLLIPVIEIVFVYLTSALIDLLAAYPHP